MLESESGTTLVALEEIKLRRTDSLSDITTKIRRYIGAGANGPLVAAGDVIALADRWDDYKQEADGLTFTQWIVGVCGAGKDLGWWERRQRAVERIEGTRRDGSARRKLHHEVAVYVAENVADEHLEEVRRMLYTSVKNNGGVPLTPAQAKRRIAKIVGSKPSARQCSRCRRLEAILKAHGIDPEAEIH